MWSVLQLLYEKRLQNPLKASNSQGSTTSGLDQKKTMIVRLLLTNEEVWGGWGGGAIRDSSIC